MDNTMKNEILDAIQNVNVKLDVIQKEVAKIPEIQKEVTKIPEMQKEIGKISEIQKQIIELQKETRSISRSVAIIEHEHGDKLKALFDAFTTHTEKIEQQDKRISLCENKLENHESKLYYLKSKVQGL